MSYLVDTKYLSETLSEEELYQNAFDRSKSNDSMENAESESEVLENGLSVIALNLGMYLGVPAILIIGIKKKF